MSSMSEFCRIKVIILGLLGYFSATINICLPAIFHNKGNLKYIFNKKTLLGKILLVV